jgi:hypothetical protein
MLVLVGMPGSGRGASTVNIIHEYPGAPALTTAARRLTS